MNYTSILIVSIIGFCTVLLMRYIGDIPFPWEFKRRNPNPLMLPDLPDAEGLAESLKKLKDGYEFNAVMGNMNHRVCNTKIVLNALKEALEKDVKINIICGPSHDSKSKQFLELLNNPKVNLFMLDSWPERHFRVIRNEKGRCKWVYVEELHPPFESYGYRCAKSHRLGSEYQKIFDMLKQSQNLSYQRSSSGELF